MIPRWCEEQRHVTAVALSKESSMTEPRQPESSKDAKSGVKPGATPNTDATRKLDRPIEEEDVFGGAERTQKGEEVQSGGAKP
jgi:hypothetical protein